MRAPFSSCSQKGYFFVPVGLHTACAKGGRLVVYVNGGVAPYGWEITGTKFALDDVSTNVQYNFVEADADTDFYTTEVMTITDACGNEAEISVCCCDPDCCNAADYDMSWPDFNRALTYPLLKFQSVEISGGCPPFKWEITGGFSFDKDYTNIRKNVLNDADTLDAEIVTITDGCTEAPLPSVVKGVLPGVFFAEDEGLGEITRLNSWPNALAERTRFLSVLKVANILTEDFESFDGAWQAGAPPSEAEYYTAADPLVWDFAGGGAINATMTDGPVDVYRIVDPVTWFTDLAGRYPISVDKFILFRNSFTLAFDTPIIAFGFYGVDFGDFSVTQKASVELVFDGGGSENVTVPHTVWGSAQKGGAVIFFGMIRPSDPFSSIIMHRAEPADVLGLDDFIICDELVV